MAKITDYIRLKNMTLLQSFITLNCLYLVTVFIAIVFQFEWADWLRQRFNHHPAGSDWVLTAQIIMMLLTIGIGLVLVASIFYKSKLKKPLEILMSASEKISRNDLGFHVVYDSRDELSELCHAFEKMRSQLENNYQVLWRSVEERHELNAIFAHDLRTPLSIIKGYLELVTTYLPQKKISEEKLLDTMQTMETHILRMERYVESMNSIQKLGDLSIHQQEMDINALIALLDDSATQIANQNGKTFDSWNAVNPTKLFVDKDIVMQVFENIVANALRHSSKRLRVDYRFDDGFLFITIEDDGSGFSEEELQKATLPFYQGEVIEADKHQGLGLYICKVLCEKHQGSLQIANHRDGGKVTASFLCRVDK